jgi:hypothetical protein
MIEIILITLAAIAAYAAFAKLAGYLARVDDRRQRWRQGGSP